MRVASHRATAAIAAVLALLVVVGASARRPLGGGAPAPSLPAWPLIAVLGAGLVVAVAVTFSALRPRTRLRGGPPEGSPETGRAVRAGPLTLALAVLLPVCIVALYASLGTSGRHATAPPPPQFGTHAPRQPKPEQPGRSGAEGAAALAAGIAAGVVGLGAWAVWRRRRGPGAGDDARAAVAAGAREARAAAAIPADPRAAVLAAYARMEAALAGAGLARRASEAPREYLGRLEAALGGGRAPAARLTELFERARFSPHHVDEGLRGDAIAALRSLQTELEAPA